MKKSMVVLACACLFALMFTFAAAAQTAPNVTGNWEMSFETPNGTRTSTWVLEQTGNTIKGTLKSQRGGNVVETPVEGTMDGDTVRLVVTRERPDGQKMTMTYAGTVSGDTMKGTIKMGENEREWTAKRAK